MSPRTILVTGGAGFIGSHVVEALARRGDRVRIFDSLDPQVHGSAVPAAPEGTEMMRGDIQDEADVERALVGAQVVIHLAAAVGVGQSMYQPAAYTRVNSLGTAVLLEKIAGRGSKVEKMVVASSMSIYGEGRYTCPACGPIAPPARTGEQMASSRWEMLCPDCGREASALPTDETKPPVPTSVYAITKRDQEESVLVMGRAYGIPAVALRFFNVYGPGQALSNPYTGVAAIFSARILNAAPPLIFEDGLQSRDFVHVRDVVQAVLLAVDRPEGDFQTFNVGTGRRTSLLELARGLAARLAPQAPIEPTLLGTFREGDIRHCYADITRIRTRLGFEPRVSLEQGYNDLVAWARTQKPLDRLESAHREMSSRGLVR